MFLEYEQVACTRYKTFWWKGKIAKGREDNSSATGCSPQRTTRGPKIHTHTSQPQRGCIKGDYNWQTPITPSMNILFLPPKIASAFLLAKSGKNYSHTLPAQLKTKNASR